MSTELEFVEANVLQRAALRYLDVLETHHPRSFVMSGSTTFSPDGSVEFGLVEPESGRSVEEVESSAMMHNCTELMLAIEGHGFLFCLDGYCVEQELYSGVADIRMAVLSNGSYDQLRKSLENLSVVREQPRLNAPVVKREMQVTEGILGWVGLHRVRRQVCDIVVKSRPPSSLCDRVSVGRDIVQRSRPAFGH
ncbi:hypothetical protein LY76DRAFT_372319 [Colletotrichum caudatum]|nr:hypothetical protein LY76DRAFT_372319 [Colletotrichum caudatum]